MRIAIHKGAGSWPTRWIEACQKRGYEIKYVDALSTDIIQQLDGCDAFMWHIVHTHPGAMLVGRSIIAAAEARGVRCLPCSATFDTFDDKIAQKYLLESVKAPMIKSWVFFDLESTERWLSETEIPFVFKLRRGAGSKNVRLVKSKHEASKLAKTAFGKGFKPRGNYALDTINKLRGKKTRKQVDLLGKLRRLPQTLKRIQATNRSLGREKGYFYAQQFVPGADHDTRVSIINGKAFCFRRLVRENDFRASGSGVIDYCQDQIDPECVRIAFWLARETGIHPLAIDYVRDPDGKQQIVEISYSFVPTAVHACPGYWSENLDFMEGQLWPEYEMIDYISRTVCSNE